MLLAVIGQQARMQQARTPDQVPSHTGSYIHRYVDKLKGVDSILFDGTDQLELNFRVRHRGRVEGLM